MCTKEPLRKGKDYSRLEQMKRALYGHKLFFVQVVLGVKPLQHLEQNGPGPLSDVSVCKSVGRKMGNATACLHTKHLIEI